MNARTKTRLIEAVNPGTAPGRVRIRPDMWVEAGRLGLRPLLAERMKGSNVCPEPHPRAVRTAVLRRNLSVQAAQQVVLKALSARRIDALILKGIALIDLAYPSFASRPTADVDLLVRKEDVPRAIGALATIGYRPMGKLPRLQDFHEVTLAKAGDGDRPPPPPIDLHWGLFSERFSTHARFDFDLPEEDLWRDANLKKHSLSEGMLFLHSIIHAFTDSFSMLSDFVDVLYVFRAVEKKVDWRRWSSDVRRFRMSGISSFTLDQVRRWWGVNYPAELDELIRDGWCMGHRISRLRQAAWRGDIGGGAERLLMPLFFEPVGRIPRSYFRMLTELVHYAHGRAVPGAINRCQEGI